MIKFAQSAGRLAAEIWTADQYSGLLSHLHGDAPPGHFALSFIERPDGYGVTRAIFRHNRTRSAENAFRSTWQALAGEARRPYALVLLPWHCRSSWCVWDFDFHDNPARRFDPKMQRNLRAFIREARALGAEGFGFIVEDSCRGWHCWLISGSQRTESEWRDIRAQIESKAKFTCTPEFLPHFGGKTKGCRAPGAANPNTWHPTREDWETSRIQAHDLPIRLELNTKDVSSSNPKLAASASPICPNGSPTRALTAKHRISGHGQRHDHLLSLVGAGAFQFGRQVLREAAITLHREATPPCRSTLEDHLAEFEAIYDDTWRNILLPCLSEEEMRFLESLTTQARKEVFIIAQNFARLPGGKVGFSLPHFARCTGLSIEGVRQIRDDFAARGVIEPLAGGYVPGIRALAYRWLLPMRSKSARQ